MNINRRVLFLFLVALTGIAGRARAQEQSFDKLTIRHVTGGTGSFVVNGFLPKWAEDGKHLAFVYKDRKFQYDAETGKQAVLPAIKAKPRAELSKDNEVYFVDKSGKRRQLTKDGKAKTEVHASPDMGHVAFVREHNLVVVDTAEGKEWAATTDGHDGLLYGRLNWVYQEELYGRFNWRAHWWSPDGKFVAFLGLDQKGVRPFTIVDHVNKPLSRDRVVGKMEMSYPKAGDPNPTVKLGIANVAKQSVTWVDLSGYGKDALVVRVTWRPDSSRVVFQVQDRIQTWLELVEADPETGKPKQLLREEAAKSWVNILGQPRWLEDGSFLWLSERTGFKHVYHHLADGKLSHAITKGDWQVRDLLHVDQKRQEIWVNASKEGAIQNHGYRVSFDGKKMQRVTEGRGWHDVDVRKDGGGFVDLWSNVERVPVVRICDRAGKPVRTLRGGRIPQAARRFGLQRKKLAKVKTRDGRMLDASVILPVGDHQAPHPIWVDTYSGPDFPSVHDRWIWADYDGFHQFLAQQGFIVLQVNVRTASGRGQADTRLCYKAFGALELNDLEDAVDWAIKTHKGDRQRVGLTGWSYGGFMTAYALTHSKKFKLGVAGAGVYDWNLYDTIYTERYMQRPQDNPEGYRNSSVVRAAKNLFGHLVLIHGTQDDNVHLQNAMILAHALQQAGKPFDLMLYPKMKHSPNSGTPKSRHMKQYIWRMIRQHLL